MNDETTALVELLREFYTDDEAFKWLTLPQPRFNGAIALDMIAAGRIGELIQLLREIQQGVFS